VEIDVNQSNICNSERMLGLGRPRLKARASLLDLITAQHTLTQPSPPAELPPLPDSPSSTTTTHSVSPHSTQASSIMTSDDSENNGSIFSVSGPVVVAENMIGCAMYELVGDRAPRSWRTEADRNHTCSVVLVMTSLLVRSFVSNQTRPLFRSTKKQVELRCPLNQHDLVITPKELC
jgi:hypothetical protein